MNLSFNRMLKLNVNAIDATNTNELFIYLLAIAIRLAISFGSYSGIFAS